MPRFFSILVILGGTTLASAQEVIHEPVFGAIAIDGEGIYSCLLSGSQLCASCVEDAGTPGASVPPLIVSFGKTGLQGWSYGTISGTVQPWIEIDGLVIPPALLPSGSEFRSGLGVGFGYVPNSPCGSQGLDYSIGPVSGSFVAGGNHPIQIAAEDAELIEFEFGFCSVSAHWGAGCGVVGSINDRWVLALPDVLQAAAIPPGDPNPITFVDQGVVLDFGANPGGIVTVLRGSGPPPLGPALSGPDGYWEFHSDLSDDSYSAEVVLSFDPPADPSEIPTMIVCYDPATASWMGLESVVDSAAATIRASLTRSCILALTTDGPVHTIQSSWGGLKSRF